jgi:hypothetical protein
MPGRQIILRAKSTGATHAPHGGPGGPPGRWHSLGAEALGACVRGSRGLPGLVPRGSAPEGTGPPQSVAREDHPFTYPPTHAQAVASAAVIAAQDARPTNYFVCKVDSRRLTHRNSDSSKRYFDLFSRGNFLRPRA